MNEKSNPMPMMYKTIPAVAELNKVMVLHITLCFPP